MTTIKKIFRISHALFFIFFFLSTTKIVNGQENEKDKDKETIVTKIKPTSSQSIFNDNNEAKVVLKLKSSYKKRQEGTISYRVTTDDGVELSTASQDISIRSHGVGKCLFTIPLNGPGFYDIYYFINLTDYDDTIRTVVGYRPYEILTPTRMPKDFTSFWQKSMDELNEVSPEYKVVKDEKLSNSTHNIYRVDMMSLGNIPIYGWLTVPKLPGKFPLMYGFGGYRQTLKPISFDDFIGFTLNPRGVGESLKIINPNDKEFFMLNVEDKEKYVYRGIYMDCIRGLQFMMWYANKFGDDTTRIGFFGGSQGATLAFVTEALSHKASFILADNPVYCDLFHTYDVVSYRPDPSIHTRIMKEYIKSHSGGKSILLKTLPYFEVQNFTPMVGCPVLLGVGFLDLLAAPASTFSAFNKLSPEVKKKSEVFVFPNLGHEVSQVHANYKGFWFYEKSVRKRKEL